MAARSPKNGNPHREYLLFAEYREKAAMTPRQRKVQQAIHAADTARLRRRLVLVGVAMVIALAAGVVIAVNL